MSTPYPPDPQDFPQSTPDDYRARVAEARGCLVDLLDSKADQERKLITWLGAWCRPVPPAFVCSSRKGSTTSQWSARP